MFKKLSREEVQAYTAARVPAEYAQFFSKLHEGEGGVVTVAEAGVSRQTVKNRLMKAAAGAGYDVRFLRSGTDTVVFEVADKKAEIAT